MQEAEVRFRRRHRCIERHDRRRPLCGRTGGAPKQPAATTAQPDTRPLARPGSTALRAALPTARCRLGQKAHLVGAQRRSAVRVAAAQGPGDGRGISRLDQDGARKCTPCCVARRSSTLSPAEIIDEYAFWNNHYESELIFRFADQRMTSFPLARAGPE